MITILCIIHLLTSLGLLGLLLSAKKIYKLPVNLYNLPIILICIIAFFGVIYAHIFYFMFILPLSVILSFMAVHSLSGDDTPFIIKITGIVITALIWPEIMALLVFYEFNKNNIDNV